MQRLTGLWRRESGKGVVYYSGIVGNTKFMVWKNDRKRKGTNDADLNLLIAKVYDDREWTRVPETPEEAAYSSAEAAAQRASETERLDELDDEIPF